MNIYAKVSLWRTLFYTYHLVTLELKLIFVGKVVDMFCVKTKTHKGNTSFHKKKTLTRPIHYESSFVIEFCENFSTTICIYHCHDHGDLSNKNGVVVVVGSLVIYYLYDYIILLR